jgi:cob(I)alamin adenosyltransferase
LIHVYTGDGKGKTTAALGLAARAACAGWRVYFGQFLKAPGSSETCLSGRFPGSFEFVHFGRPGFIGPGGPSPEDHALAAGGLSSMMGAVSSGRWDLVVADEILVALGLGLLDETGVLGLVEAARPGPELVLTGRGATPAVIGAADLVTEMRALKHYFERGIEARKGIEN